MYYLLNNNYINLKHSLNITFKQIQIYLETYLRRLTCIQCSSWCQVVFQLTAVYEMCCYHGIAISKINHKQSVCFG